MAGSVTQTWSKSRNGNLNVWIVELSITASGSDGTLTSVPLSTDVMNRIGGSYLFLMETLAVTTAPNAWSVTLTDARGVDVLLGAGATLSVSTTVPQKTVPKQDSNNAVYGAVYVPCSGLTLNMTGNSTASAKGIVQLFCSA